MHQASPDRFSARQVRGESDVKRCSFIHIIQEGHFHLYWLVDKFQEKLRLFLRHFEELGGKCNNVGLTDVDLESKLVEETFTAGENVVY